MCQVSTLDSHETTWPPETMGELERQRGGRGGGVSPIGRAKRETVSDRRAPNIKHGNQYTTSSVTYYKMLLQSIHNNNLYYEMEVELSINFKILLHMCEIKS